MAEVQSGATCCSLAKPLICDVIVQMRGPHLQIDNTTLAFIKESTETFLTGQPQNPCKGVNRDGNAVFNRFLF